ncbi:MAG TPA: DUF4082 domain-containing protein, partial [Actinomycetes bacterium]|nr:DUF4082 domain-containing protein [Actinomycetes bacterium]
VSPIACENSKPGTPQSTWDISGAGDSTIQGFTTDISVNVGQIVHFKIKTNARAYSIQLYRLGYYGGNGARLIATIQPSASLPQNQPACLSDTAVGLTDCGNWAESASWPVPSTAVSGIYLAMLRRSDTGGENQVPFVVRNDASHSDLLFQTSDTTWQAYNRYGNGSLYTAPSAPANRAYKVSYNRPFITRACCSEDFVFSNEFPMVRFLERNGYDVTYSTGVDTDRRGSLIQQHRVFLSVGHDEYWSAGQRAAVEAARNAGVNLAFFSGNEIFWKTRWEASVDGSATPNRTLVTYKETAADAVIDPADPPTWTGTWRDPRFSPPADGGKPENALSGTQYVVDCCAVPLKVPAADGKLRFWRNTAVASQAPGGVATLTPDTVGYEWDVDPDNSARPAGLFHLSGQTESVPNLLQDYGSRTAPGIATHHLTLYRATSGALVFGAGTVQWSWGLDDVHDYSRNQAGGNPDRSMQQATVNLLADMRAQPATLMAGLAAASQSTDTTAPTSTITSPAPGASLKAGDAVTVSGTAADAGGGRVGGVEVSVDGGTTWHPAEGREQWTFDWTADGNGATTIRSRAVDDSGNLESPSAGVGVNVSCPCSIWSGMAVPRVAEVADDSAVELGVKFRADRSGYVTGIRFYASAGNTGTHLGNLWDAAGNRLATVTFPSSQTSPGWQQANFAAPVAVSANTTYVASYHTDVGHYAADQDYFQGKAVDNSPLHALASGTDGPNGVYRYGASGFPTSSYRSSNYWVDVVFATTAVDNVPPAVVGQSPPPDATQVPTSTAVSATFSEPVQPATVAFSLADAAGHAVAGATGYDGATRTATFTPSAALAEGVSYTATVDGAKDLAGNQMAAPATWTFTTAAPRTCPCTIWPSSATPATPAAADSAAVELGVRFRTDTNGYVTGLRFYKGSGNTGTHVGNLWTNGGTRLATATFSAETATGWQQVTLPAPVAVTANTTYVASYHTDVGHYAVNTDFFASSGVANPPLRALANGVDGANGVYRYGASGFPTSSYRSSNYWVDVVFATTAPSGAAPSGAARTRTRTAKRGV